MTDSKKEIEANIRAQIKKLSKKIVELKDFTEPVSPDDAIGRISRMDVINNKTIFDAGMRNSQERLGQLTEILKHIYDADFGICTKCHQSIPAERLKIRLCSNCLKK